MKYRAVIFDLDGTLVSTKPEYRYKVVGNTLEQYNMSASDRDIDSFWFETDRDGIIKRCFGLEPKEFWQMFRKYDMMELRKQYTSCYDDVDFIEELRQNGYKTGIVTGAPLHIASLEIEMIGEENFDGIVVARDKIKAKPHPHGLKECLSQLEVDSENAIYVGNGEEDIKTAVNANVKDVLILRGEYEFSGIDCSHRIRSLYELRAIIGYG